MTGLRHDPHQFSFQEMGRGLFYQHFDNGTGAQPVAFQVHQLVLSAATRIDVGAAFLGRPFD